MWPNGDDDTIRIQRGPVEQDPPRDAESQREPYTQVWSRSETPQQRMTNWFQRHWLGLMLLAQLGLTAVFIFFAARYGLTGSTVLFALLAAYSLVGYS